MEYQIKDWATVDDVIDASHCEPSHTDFEEWCEIKRLLKFDLGLRLPLSLKKRERPDFEVVEVSGARQIGCEHTWAAHEGWEQSEQYLLNTKNPPFQSISRNCLEGEHAKGKELGRRLARQQGNSPIWGVREQAEAKAEEVKRAIAKKLEALANDGFEKYPENWLLVSDRLPFLFLDLECFKDSLKGFELLVRSGYSRILFLTQVRDREHSINVHALLELSSDGISVVNGHAQQGGRGDALPRAPHP